MKAESDRSIHKVTTRFSCRGKLGINIAKSRIYFTTSVRTYRELGGVRTRKVDIYCAGRGRGKGVRIVIVENNKSGMFSLSFLGGRGKVSCPVLLQRILNVKPGVYRATETDKQLSSGRRFLVFDLDIRKDC